MNRCQPNQVRRGRRPYGYTLLELLISSSVATILMAGLGSSVYVASQAFEADTSASTEIVDADQHLAQLMRDAQAATEISELTATAVTLTVPDRDGDNQAETIRYAWSGIAGDPLTYQYNGGPVENLAENVQAFELEYLSRFMEGESGGKLVFISGEPDSPSEYEQQRIQLIESWGFQVVIIQYTESKGQLSKAVGDADVVYISGEVPAAAVGTNFSSFSTGIVCEQYDLARAFGFCEDTLTNNDEDVAIVDNSHYITSDFSLGELDVSDVNNSLYLMAVDGDEGFAAQAQTLATFDGGDDDGPSLVVFETGATDYNGRTVPARRVMLPWGAFKFDPALLNAAGHKIMKRSIEWAASNDVQAAAAQTNDSSQSWFSKWLDD